MSVYDRLKRNSNTAFIIGGGPSFNKLVPDHSILKDKDVIAINSAVKFFPNALACVFMDMHWYQNNEERIRDFKGVPVVGAVDSELLFYKERASHVSVLLRDGDTGLSKTTHKVCGSNSGHMAINVAVNMGYSDIVLLGFDMDRLSPETHWHNEYIRRSNVDRYASVMIPCLDTIVPELGETRVWNINRNSAIKCFPFADLKDFL